MIQAVIETAFEGTLGFATLALVCYGMYRLVF